jgi:hypothetical protein
MKCLQNETIRAKRVFGSDVEPYLQDKPTNARFEASAASRREMRSSGLQSSQYF